MLSVKLRFLNPEKIELHQDKRDLKLKMDENEEYSISEIRPTFPITNFGKFVNLYDKKGKEIGVIKDYRKLRPTSKKILEQELQKDHFVEIKEIEEITEKENDYLIWKVQTNKGSCKFEIMREMLFMRGKRVIIFDNREGKFEISDYEKLPRQSRKLFDKHF